MSVYPYFVLIFIISLIGAVGTIIVGNSKSNKEGNPEYDYKTRGNWSRLTLFYILAIVFGFSALTVFIIVN